jgi:hypothetical protein
MRWRVVVELTGADGSVQMQEVGTGGNTIAACSTKTLGLALVDGKRILAELQHSVMPSTEARMAIQDDEREPPPITSAVATRVPEAARQSRQA